MKKYAALLLMSLVVSDAYAQEVRVEDVKENTEFSTLNGGIYTAEQAASGKPLFERNCSSCHNADFYKTTLSRYNGQPLVYMFEFIMAGMPADKPGTLMDSEYEDILAHILMLVGFPAGEQRLTYDSDAMKNIKVYYSKVDNAPLNSLK